ncbi:class I SAM-dependent methyltransferase [Laspinema olomoucense]|uniref:class I SAM-dependent methyltransferase n=1 Tax=Laspinema olomoucense TaxID=3231600 RepID=UPI0021BBAA76|nr:class I SAM-dependent methyltransferase [Laspinema sp. D3a]MCT7988435.1 class I SAM-dependent methyltransferase [Laspinema sp. D3a]
MNNPNDPRRFAPATQRNREPILKVLRRVLPPRGTVLEVASGSGEHAIFFAPRLKPRFWQPSEPEPLLRESILAWMKEVPSDNLFPPIPLNVAESVWLIESAENPPVNLSEITAIIAINLIHISPFTATLGLMAGAGRILPTGGILYLYGPFKRGGKHTAPTNESFDEMLQQQNSEWGVRNLEEVEAVARKNGLNLQEIVEMPANNLSVIFRRESEG